MSNPYVIWIFKLLMPISFSILFWVFIQNLFRRRHPYFLILGGVACLYPLGKVWQLWVLPGRIPRSYMSDIGWCFFWATMGYYKAIVSNPNKNPWFIARIYIWFYGLAAIGFEILMIVWLNKYARLSNAKFKAMGDPMDVIVFLVCLLCTDWLSKSLGKAWEDYYETKQPEAKRRFGRRRTKRKK